MTFARPRTHSLGPAKYEPFPGSCGRPSASPNVDDELSYCSGKSPISALVAQPERNNRALARAGILAMGSNVRVNRPAEASAVAGPVERAVRPHSPPQVHLVKPLTRLIRACLAYVPAPDVSPITTEKSDSSAVAFACQQSALARL